MAKDALGHGSDPQGLGNGPDPRGLRSHIQIVGQGGFSGKKLGVPSSSAGQALVNSIRSGGGVDVHPAMSVADHKKFGPFADIVANYRANGGKPPRDHAAEQRGFNSGKREIARLRRQGK
jgi:hypothetical protein